MNDQTDVSKPNFRRWGIAALLLFAAMAVGAREIPHSSAEQAAEHPRAPSSPLLQGVKPLKDWGKSAGDVIADRHTELPPVIRVASETTSPAEDDNEVPHKARPIVWNLDYPSPGKLKLGHWKFGQSRGIGLVASFPISGKR